MPEIPLVGLLVAVWAALAALEPPLDALRPEEVSTLEAADPVGPGVGPRLEADGAHLAVVGVIFNYKRRFTRCN